MSRWFNYYSFDVIGDLTFGKSFDMLITGKDAYMLKTLHKQMQSLGPFLHSIWILALFKLIPGLNNSYLEYFEWVKDQVENRIKVIDNLLLLVTNLFKLIALSRMCQKIRISSCSSKRISATVNKRQKNKCISMERSIQVSSLGGLFPPGHEFPVQGRETDHLIVTQRHQL
jgi:hypothetical protein